MSMTENEAVVQLNFDMEMIRFNPETGETLTLEQIKAQNEDNYKTYLADEMAITALIEIQQYRAIGTVEEFKALKEKDTPKKPIIKEWCPAICPNCKQNLSESRGDGYWLHYTSLERCDCGQKLDWSE